ncbi:hypothetical protein ZWY2020_006919 [Hordeum vulgare]|nr:hypothetical protein ZWY2020_006919 [Hordeum vulgare]
MWWMMIITVRRGDFGVDAGAATNSDVDDPPDDAAVQVTRVSTQPSNLEKVRAQLGEEKRREEKSRKGRSSSGSEETEKK